MRKLKYFCLYMMLIFTFVSCGNNGEKDNGQQKETVKQNDTEIEKTDEEENKRENQTDESKNDIKILKFEKIINNSQSNPEGVTGGVYNMEKAIVGDSVFYINVFEDGSLCKYDINTKEISVLNTPGEEYMNVGRIYADKGSKYYYDGVSLYEITQKDGIKKIVDSVENIRVFSICDDIMCYTKDGEEYSMYIRNLKDNSEEIIEGIFENAIHVDNYVYAITNGNILKYNMETNEKEVISEAVEAKEIYMMDERILLQQTDSVKVFDLKTEKITGTFLDEYDVFYCNNENGYGYSIYNEDDEKNIYTDCFKSENIKYEMTFDDSENDSVFVSELIADEKYVVVYGADANSGLYVGVKLD